MGDDLVAVLQLQRRRQVGRIGVHLERPLRELGRERRVGRDGRRQLEGPVDQVVVVDELAYEAAPVCLVGRHRATGEHPVGGHAQPDDAGEEVAHPHLGAGEPEEDGGVAERGRGRADAHVGGQAQRQPAAHGGPVHGRDHRLWQGSDGLRQSRHRLLEAQAVDGRIAGLEHGRPEVTHVDARAETATGAGEDHDAGVPRCPDRGERLDELGYQHLVESVQALRPVEPQEHDAVSGRLLDESRHTRSRMVAVPMPAPVHMVTRPTVRSRRSSSSRSVPMSMAPVAPMGWPRAMAPPFTLTASGSRSRSRMVLSGTAANASLISHSSTSAAVMPAFARQRAEAGPGAVNMITGSDPMAAVARTRARGVAPLARTHASDATSAAAAPSTTPDELPAWCTCSIRSTSGYFDSAISSKVSPCSAKAGRSLASPSSVVPGRGCSSRSSRISPFGPVTGTIPRAKRPSSMATAARRWLSTAYASTSARPKPSMVAIRSAEIPWGTVGNRSRKAGLSPSIEMDPTERFQRDIDSTPPATTRS